MSETSETSETVQLPWIDEPVELSEAVELIAQADNDDDDTIKKLRSRVKQLERRTAGLEDGSSVSCPSCGSSDQVYKAGVGAALLASRDSLSESSAKALNQDSHVCLDCRKGFTPHAD
ncbi:hypothetical protein [Halobacterium wangiae]|uniref:hypothetical protein n=1 Tax=Halobacterium wangiae TaxID=2902623 RepID=UPI001E60A6BD|nr:hypothetical protein [Halobacterium wangiae]